MLRASVAAVATVLLVGCSPAPTSPGTGLTAPPAHGWSTIQDVGTRFTDGFETLDVASEPIEVTAIRIVGGEPGIEVIGYELVPPGRRCATIQSMPGYAPTDPDLPTDRVPTGGQLSVDPAGQGYQVLLGLEVTAEGRWVRTEVVVEYRSAGGQYEPSLPARLAVCTPGAVDHSGECALP